MRRAPRIVAPTDSARAGIVMLVAISLMPPIFAATGAHAQPLCTITQITSGTGNFAGDPVISADGGWIAFRSNRNLGGLNPNGNMELFLYDRESAAFAFATTSSSQTRGLVAVSADGSYVAFSSPGDFVGQNADGNGEIFLWERATSTFTQVTHTTGGLPFQFASDNPSLSADGQQLSFTSDRDLTGANADGSSEVFLYRRTTAALTQISHRSPGDATAGRSAVSGSGRWVAFTDGDGELRLHDVTSGQSAVIVPTGHGIKSDSSLDHSGNRIVFFSNVTPGGQSLSLPEVFLHDRGAGSTLRLTHHTTPDVNPAVISPDGNRIALFSTLNLAGGNADGGHELFLYDVPSATYRQITAAANLPLSFTGVPSLDLTGDRIAFEAAADLTGQNPTSDFQIFLATCQPPLPLALRAGRFQVRAQWRTAQGSGVGTPVALTPESGYFWFFNPGNVELVGKVLDGCGLPPGRLWFFGAGLTNVEVRLAVTDTKTQALRTYFNRLGRNFRPVQDTATGSSSPA